MAGTRPYYIDFNGTVNMVEATSPAAAVRHVVGGDIREIRPARGAEVMAWTRAGKDIVIAGTKAVVTPTETAVVADETVDIIPSKYAQLADPEFTIGQVVVLVEKGSDYDPAALTAINAVKSEGRMTLENFDIIRTTYPEFVLPICQIPLGSPIALNNIDDMRAQLEQEPMSAQEVADRVMGYAQAEAAEVGREEAMVGTTGHLDA
jgi:hypothetical protein